MPVSELSKHLGSKN